MMIRLIAAVALAFAIPGMASAQTYYVPSNSAPTCKTPECAAAAFQSLSAPFAVAPASPASVVLSSYTASASCQTSQATSQIEYAAECGSARSGPVRNVLRAIFRPLKARQTHTEAVSSCSAPSQGAAVRVVACHNP